MTGKSAEALQLLWRDTLIDGAIFREWIVNTGRRSAVSRTAHLFCELFVRAQVIGLASKDECDLDLTQTPLADATGLSIVHLNRSLQELRRRNLIEYQRGHLTIKDWPGLTKIGDFDDAYLHLDSARAA